MIERARAASGAAVRWSGPQPLALSVQPGLDAPAVVDAAAAWGTTVQIVEPPERGQISVRRARADEWTLGESFAAHTRCTDDPTSGVRTACEVRIAPWGLRATENADLSCVMRHEWGHVMGLEHSLDRGAAMYPGGSFLRPCSAHVSAEELAAAGERDLPVRSTRVHDSERHSLAIIGMLAALILLGVWRWARACRAAKTPR